MNHSFIFSDIGAVTEIRNENNACQKFLNFSYELLIFGIISKKNCAISLSISSRCEMWEELRLSGDRIRIDSN